MSTRGENISKAKKGKLKTKLAALRTGKIRSEKLKKIYALKRALIGNSRKSKRICGQCSKEFYVFPSRKTSFCSKKCRVLARTGKPHVNWNPKSMSKSGRGICGIFENITFRSTYELSFIIKNLIENKKIVYEPVQIKFSQYLSQDELIKFKIRQNQKYVPDFLIDNLYLVEIKIKKLLNYDINIAKQLVGLRFCKESNLIFKILTEDDLLTFSDEQLNCFARRYKEKLVFYRKKDKKRFYGS
jgi:hypothetical protein